MSRINNIPASAKRFVVARNVDGELWYWGSWNNQDAAIDAANAIGGIVIEME